MLAPITNSNTSPAATPLPQSPSQHITKEDLLLINRLLLDLYKVKSRDDQARATLELLRELVPSFLACWTRYNPVTRELQFSTLPHFPVPPERIQQLAAVSHQAPFPAYFAASRDRSWRMLTDFMPAEEFQRTQLFQYMYAPMCCTHIISTMLNSVDAEQFSLTLCRTEPAYSERDRAVLNLVHPHLSLSYYNSHAYAQAQESIAQYQTVIEAAPIGYVFVRPDGQITWATAKAKELWRQYFPDDATNEQGVPVSITHWLHRYRNQPAGLLPLAETCLTKESSAGILEMRLIPSPFEGAIVSLSSVALPRPRFQPLAELSSRQNETLQWMVEGKRNSEIAVILNISERTVEKHVAEVLARLQAENRATAIVRAMENCAAANLTPASFDATI